jgi:hypothetical protein
MGGANPPRHGTPSGYTTGGCRLACCTAASTRYNKVYRMRALNGPTKVPTVGAVRRIRALQAMGWTLKDIAAAVGVKPGGSFGTLANRASITRSMHDRIAAAYDRLQATPGPSDRARQYAKRQGWAPPFAWDEGALDDPNARPDFGTPERGFDLDEWVFLVDCGESPERAAERCGVTLNAVSKAAYRAGRTDIANFAESARKRWSAA